MSTKAVHSHSPPPKSVKSEHLDNLVVTRTLGVGRPFEPIKIRPYLNNPYVIGSHFETEINLLNHRL